MYLDVALTGQYVPSRNSSSRAGDVLRRAIERLRPQTEGANPESADTPIVAELRARLETIEQEADRVTRLALKEDEVAKQEAYLALARDMQREAREIREQMRLQKG